MHVLLIEDNAETADYVTQGLTEQGWTVDHHPSPDTAILPAGTGQHDAIILDRMLPGMDGLDVLKLLRGAKVTTPVIMLTARSGIDDRVEGLEAGADDYLIKPFAVTELVARLKSLARRPALTPEVTSLTTGDLHLDRLSRQASRGGTSLDLSPLEFKLLDCLMAHTGQVVTRAMLLEMVWGYRFDPKTSLVQTHMSRLRAKVDDDGGARITTVRGSGYVLT